MRYNIALAVRELNCQTNEIYHRDRVLQRHTRNHDALPILLPSNQDIQMISPSSISGSPLLSRPPSYVYVNVEFQTSSLQLPASTLFLHACMTTFSKPAPCFEDSRVRSHSRTVVGVIISCVQLQRTCPTQWPILV